MVNKKGFTLVELLAVIVILALIMGIAVVSISGVMQNARNNSYMETALAIINGVRQRVVLANEQKEGTYYFDDSILESGGKKSPFGADILIGNPDEGGGEDVSGTTGIYWKEGMTICRSTSNSFVSVYKENDAFKYRICLTAGLDEKYINSTEDALLGGSDSSTVYESDPPVDPSVPTISGGTTAVYGHKDVTLTCSTATTYEEGSTVNYEFGYATSTANFTAGTITWLGSPSTTATTSITRSSYRGSRLYTCRIYVSNDIGHSNTIQSTTTTTMSFVNSRINFDATTNGGTISGSATLYVPYGATNIYTGKTNTTAGTIPTATKSGATFTGWWTAASGGTKVINASRVVQANVSGWTDANKKWQRTSTSTSATANKLYAQFS